MRLNNASAPPFVPAPRPRAVFSSNGKVRLMARPWDRDGGPGSSILDLHTLKGRGGGSTIRQDADPGESYQADGLSSPGVQDVVRRRPNLSTPASGLADPPARRVGDMFHVLGGGVGGRRVGGMFPSGVFKGGLPLFYPPLCPGKGRRMGAAGRYIAPTWFAVPAGEGRWLRGRSRIPGDTGRRVFRERK